MTNARTIKTSKYIDFYRESNGEYLGSWSPYQKLVIIEGRKYRLERTCTAIKKPSRYGSYGKQLYEFVCSECGSEILLRENYCSNCGARQVKE